MNTRRKPPPKPQVTGIFLICPKYVCMFMHVCKYAPAGIRTRTVGSTTGESPLAVSGNTLDHTAIRAGPPTASRYKNDIENTAVYYFISAIDIARI